VRRLLRAPSTVAGQRLRQPTVAAPLTLQLADESPLERLSLRAVVFCLRDVRAECLVGRQSAGLGGTALVSHLRVPLGATGPPDLFAAVCLRGADLLIANSATVAPRLPAWFRERTGAPTFLLLPVLVRGKAVGLIYADKAAADSLVLGEAELLHVKNLRDQLAATLSRA
jgi:hypothetical protein